MAKPWHTKEWKEMRGERIADLCEQCGSTKGTFVLQHFSHYERVNPLPSMKNVLWDILSERGVLSPRPTVERRACPECEYRSIYERKGKPTWRCQRCNNEFDDPLMVEVEADSRTGRDEFAQYKEECHHKIDTFLVERAAEANELYLPYLERHEKELQASRADYMSGEGTATFCKKCAFLWDMKGQRLCHICRNNYHPFRFKNCYNCLPASIKEQNEDYKKFAEEMDKVMETLERENQRISHGQQ